MLHIILEIRYSQYVTCKTVCCAPPTRLETRSARRFARAKPVHSLILFSLSKLKRWRSELNIHCTSFTSMLVTCGHVIDIVAYLLIGFILDMATFLGLTVYVYTAVCNNLEPLIYISISIYRVHCGKGSTWKCTSSQSNVDKHVISSIYWPWISSRGYMLMISLRPGTFLKLNLHICIYWYISRAQKFGKQLYICICIISICTYVYVCMYVCICMYIYIYIFNIRLC